MMEMAKYFDNRSLYRAFSPLIITGKFLLHPPLFTTPPKVRRLLLQIIINTTVIAFALYEAYQFISLHSIIDGLNTSGLVAIVLQEVMTVLHIVNCRMLMLFKGPRLSKTIKRTWKLWSFLSQGRNTNIQRWALKLLFLQSLPMWIFIAELLTLILQHGLADIN